MVVLQAVLGDPRRMFVELAGGEDVVAGHVPVRQREHAGQQRRAAAAMAAQQHRVGVFVAGVRCGVVAALGQQPRLPVHDGDLIRMVQPAVHPGDVQGAVVGAEGTFDIADSRQSIPEQRERAHQLVRIAIGAALDGLDRRLDHDDGLKMLGNGDALLRILQRNLLRRNLPRRDSLRRLLRREGTVDRQLVGAALARLDSRAKERRRAGPEEGDEGESGRSLQHLR